MASESSEQPPAGRNPHASAQGSSALLVLTALGVVYGDIGTSPLYAFRECFSRTHAALAPTPENILGVLSTITWSLVLLISIKYLAFIMRADNRGEGGILALVTLAVRPKDISSRRRAILLTMGVFGACLLYSDAMITPAISVLSAVEGLNVATHVFEPYVVMISIAILVLLFVVQQHGTARIGTVFGPIMLLWFLILASIGLMSIARQPAVLAALDPRHAVVFFRDNGATGFGVLGAVFLAITGGEVLYADMGHFGRAPIRRGWFMIAMPALLLNYLGQGSCLMRDPTTADNIFYRTAPAWSLYPLVGLATLATIIASQAVISGAFSLSRQAIQLGYCPRMSIRQTSSTAVGQIYVPGINWSLLAATVLLILGFRRSGSLAGAYGVAVSTTMLITTILFYFVARHLWNWRRLTAGLVVGALLILDISFFSSNLIKIALGGWVPLLVAGGIYLLLVTWHHYRSELRVKFEEAQLPVDLFLEEIRHSKPTRVPGTAVFLTGSDTGIPRSLLHNFKHNKVLHRTIVLTTVRTQDVPYVAPEDRLSVQALGDGFYRMTLLAGFSETANVPAALASVNRDDLKFNMMDTTFFLGRETYIVPQSAFFRKQSWRKRLFVFMSRNAQDATLFFGLPPNRVVELGTQIQI